MNAEGFAFAAWVFACIKVGRWMGGASDHGMGCESCQSSWGLLNRRTGESR